MLVQCSCALSPVRAVACLSGVVCPRSRPAPALSPPAPSSDTLPRPPPRTPTHPSRAQLREWNNEENMFLEELLKKNALLQGGVLQGLWPKRLDVLCAAGHLQRAPNAPGSYLTADERFRTGAALCDRSKDTVRTMRQLYGLQHLSAAASRAMASGVDERLVAQGMELVDAGAEGNILSQVWRYTVVYNGQGQKAQTLDNIRTRLNRKIAMGEMEARAGK